MRSPSIVKVDEPRPHRVAASLVQDTAIQFELRVDRHPREKLCLVFQFQADRGIRPTVLAVHQHACCLQHQVAQQEHRDHKEEENNRHTYDSPG